MAEERRGDEKTPIIRDVKRYICEYCGICRSKKLLIVSHILADHQDEMNNETDSEVGEVEGQVSNTCQECGVTFKKPAHLKQHMQSHSLERPFRCYMADCSASYRQKDHLNRHLLTHERKVFKYPLENCNKEFSVKSNMRRHADKHHDNHDNVDDGEHSSTCANSLKQHVCLEFGCGKVFKYPSQLWKHHESHVKVDSVEAFCAELGCMKYLTNEECLRAHVKCCHQYINCEICGSKQLKKNIKRHLRTHEDASSPEEIRCSFKGCSKTFSNASNLRKHLKAVHEDLRPFICGFTGCGMRFAYKHVRDNHEKAGCHIYTCGDFVELDEQFLSRPRGGQKRKHFTAEMLVRKRVMPRHFDSCL